MNSKTLLFFYFNFWIPWWNQNHSSYYISTYVVLTYIVSADIVLAGSRQPPLGWHTSFIGLHEQFPAAFQGWCQSPLLLAPKEDSTQTWAAWELAFLYRKPMKRRLHPVISGHEDLYIKRWTGSSAQAVRASFPLGVLPRCTARSTPLCPLVSAACVHLIDRI